jgi:hypothetical protein
MTLLTGLAFPRVEQYDAHSSERAVCAHLAPSFPGGDINQLFTEFGLSDGHRHLDESIQRAKRAYKAAGTSGGIRAGKRDRPRWG